MEKEMAMEEEYSGEMARSKMEEEEEEEYSDATDEYSDEMDDEEESEEESDEEIILDGDRVEVDRGYIYVLKDGRTVTRPEVATKIYFRSERPKYCHPIKIVHKGSQFALTTLSKLALDRYNDIEGTKYEYVGLVKAYSLAVAGFRFWIRFKACLNGQDDINFQASLFQGLPDRITSVVYVDVKFVYPLPAPVMPVNVLAQQVKHASMQP